MRFYDRNASATYLDLGMVNGKRVRLSVVKFFREVQRATVLGQKVREPMALNDAINKYLRRCSYGIENRYGRPKSSSQADTDTRVLERLLKYAGNVQAHTMTSTLVHEFMAAEASRVCGHTRRRLTTSTLNRIKAVLTSFFRFLERDQHVSVSPAKGLRQSKENNLRLNWVASEEEVRAWREQLSDTPRDVFDTLVRTAMRLNEVLRLRPADYDRSRNTLCLPDPKEHRIALIPVSPFVRAIVERRLGGQLLFPNEHTGEPYTPDGIHTTFYRARDRAGLRKFRVHDLRRTAATHMLRRGVNVRVIQAILRHRSLDTTMRYLGVGQEQVADAVATIDDLGLPERDGTKPHTCQLTV